MKNLKKALGYLIITSLFIGIFLMISSATSFLDAILVFVISIGILAIVALAAYLISDY